MFENLCKAFCQFLKAVTVKHLSTYTPSKNFHWNALAQYKHNTESSPCS